MFNIAESACVVLNTTTKEKREGRGGENTVVSHSLNKKWQRST